MPGIMKMKLFIMPLDADTPEHWDAMPPNTSCMAVTIKAGTAEYTDILNLFQASCQRPIIKVECI